MRLCRAPILIAAVTLPLFSPPLAAALDASDVPPTLKTARETAAESSLTLPAGTIMRVTSSERVKPSRLRAGDELQAELPRPVFLRERRAIPAGSQVRLSVEEIRRVKVDAEKTRGWSAFLRRPFAGLLPRHRYDVSFRSAEIVMADGTVVPFKPSLLEVRESGTVAAGAKRSSAKTASSRQGSTLILLLEEALTLPRQSAVRGDLNADAGPSPQQEVRARVMLLAPISAAKSQAGETFRARVLEPLRLGDQLIVPEGSTVQGRIAWRKPPRRLRRAGTMRLSFGELTLPEGGAAEISASLLAVEGLPSSRLILDPEGTLRASAASRKRAAIDLGVAYALGKIADDVLEEGVKAGVSAASAGAVTTAARYVGIGVGLVYFFAQRGRDVSLPQYTELEIAIARPEARGENLAPPPAASPN